MITYDDLYDGMKVEDTTLEGLSGTIRRRHGRWEVDYYIKKEAEDGHYCPFTSEVINLTLKNIKKKKEIENVSNT